jgi:hypothetical protein
MSRWFEPTIKDSKNKYPALLYVVVDCIGEGLRQKPMKSKDLSVDASVKAQRLEVSVEAIEIVNSKTCRLPLVEMIAGQQVVLGKPVKLNEHLRKLPR